MVVGRCTSRLPLRPLPLLAIGSVGKKPSRRNLFGSPPPGELIKIATEILDATAAEFAARWNFDPISEKPLSGNILWTPVNPKIKFLPDANMDVSIKKELVNDSKNLPSHTSADLPKLGDVESFSNKLTAKNNYKKTPKIRLKQTKITEFAKVKKKTLLRTRCVKK